MVCLWVSRAWGSQPVHSPEGLKSQAFHGWELFCDCSFNYSLWGLASLSLDGFNAVIEHLLCAPLVPSLWQRSRQPKYSLNMMILMPAVWMERPSGYCGQCFICSGP